MKKIFLFIISLFAVHGYVSAQSPSCCNRSATSTFASLGNDESFVNAHLAPLSFTYTPVDGKMLTIQSPDGKVANAYYVKKNGGNKTLILFHEWWGLNDYIKQEAEKWATALGVNVIAPDLYEGSIGNFAIGRLDS